jgi:hypothetical protein
VFGRDGTNHRVVLSPNWHMLTFVLTVDISLPDADPSSMDLLDVL